MVYDWKYSIHTNLSSPKIYFPKIEVNVFFQNSFHMRWEFIRFVSLTSRSRVLSLTDLPGKAIRTSLLLNVNEKSLESGNQSYLLSLHILLIKISVKSTIISHFVPGFSYIGCLPRNRYSNSKSTLQSPGLFSVITEIVI